MTPPAKTKTSKWGPKLEWTQAELDAEAARRFGPDPRTWAFVCPSCADVADASDFLMAEADPNRVGTECIGRHLGALSGASPRVHRLPNRARQTRGCDWAAYGLFSGPWTIVVPPVNDEGIIIDGPTKRMPAFALAEAPRVRSAHELAPVREAWEARFAESGPIVNRETGEPVEVSELPEPPL